MKKRNNVIIPSQYIFTGLMLVCLVLIFISYATDFSGGPLKVMANYVIVPLEKGVSYVTDSFTSHSKDSRSRQELADENADLNAQIEELNTIIANQNIKLKQLDRLNSLLSLKEEYSDYPTTGAKIIASGATNYYNTFTIDKGSKDGIAKNMNVITTGGLVGIVTEVGNNYAIVRSMIDDSTNISASFASTNDNCIISGDYDLYRNHGLLAFSNLDDDNGAVKNGDIVVTSSISDKYLPDIMIGYAVDINRDINNLTVSGTVVPSVDFKHLKEVLVILTVKENYKVDGD